MDEDFKPRKPRVDSYASTSAAMQAAHRPVEPPEHMTLTAGDRLHFDAIIAEMPKVDLTEHQVTVAAILATTMQAVHDQMNLLRVEGYVTTAANGNRVANPRAAIVNQMSTTLLALRRSLGIHARALAGGDLRRTGIRNAHNLSAEQTVNGLDDDDDLLARPNVVPFNRKDH